MRGYWGVEIAAIVTLIPAIGALVLSNTIENIKQENDLATYKEILAFMNARRRSSAILGPSPAAAGQRSIVMPTTR